MQIKHKKTCLSGEIAAYIDGELSADDERQIESHIAGCRPCGEALNEQKTFLSALSSTLENEKEVELPRDFTKIIVTNAESRVSGLRRPKELFNAIFICTALALFGLFALGVNPLGVFVTFIEQTAAVLGFAAQMIYNFGVGAAIILRSLSSQFALNSTLSISLLALFAFSIFGISRFIFRFDR